MKSYDSLINEAVKSIPRNVGIDDKLIKWLRYSVDVMSKYKTAKVLWRGFDLKVGGYVKVPAVNYIALVTNKKQRVWRGSTHGLTDPHEAINAIISGISKSTPVFCTQDYSKAKFFGNPYVVVPIPEFSVASSAEIADIGALASNRSGSGKVTKAEYTDDEIKAFIDSYVISKNKIPNTSGYREVILDSKRYGLIDVGQLIRANRSKFLKIKNVEDIRTYDDVMHVINNTLSYFEWQRKR